MAAKVVFFSSSFVEASPETLGFLWNANNGGHWPRWSSSAAALWRPALKHWGFCEMLRMAAKVVFFSNGFVEASPETLGFLWNAENGGQGGLLQQWLCGGQA